MKSRTLPIMRRHIRAVVQERRKKEREEDEKRMAEQRAAEDARRKAEEVSKPCPRKRGNKIQIATTETLSQLTTLSAF